MTAVADSARSPCLKSTCRQGYRRRPKGPLPYFLGLSRNPRGDAILKRREFGKRSSQYQESLCRRFPDRGERNPSIEGHEPSSAPNREGKQIQVGQLPRSMNSGRVHDFRIQQTDSIRPEFMDVLLAGLGQMLNDSLNWQRVSIAWIRHDPDTSILRDGT